MDNSATKQGISNIASMAYGYGSGAVEHALIRTTQSAGDLRSNNCKMGVETRPQASKMNSFSQSSSLLNYNPGREASRKLSPFRKMALKELLGNKKEKEHSLFHHSFSGTSFAGKELDGSETENLNRSISDVYGFFEDRRARSNSRSRSEEKDRSQSRGRRSKSKKEEDAGRSLSRGSNRSASSRSSKSRSPSQSHSRDKRRHSKLSGKSKPNQTVRRKSAGLRRARSTAGGDERDRSQSASSRRGRPLRTRSSGTYSPAIPKEERDRSESSTRKGSRPTRRVSRNTSEDSPPARDTSHSTNSQSRKTKGTPKRTKSKGEKKQDRSRSGSRNRKPIATEQIATALGPAPPATSELPQEQQEEEWIPQWDDTVNPVAPTLPSALASDKQSTTFRSRAKKTNTKDTPSGIQPGMYRNMIQS